MRKVGFAAIIVLLLILPVSAMEFTLPDAPAEAQKYMPEETESFGEGVWYILKNALSDLQPSILEATKTCISITAVVMLLAVLESFSGGGKKVALLVGALALGGLFLSAANSFVYLGKNTIESLDEYGKLVFPVMAAAMAAQGGTSASAALYAGTAFFDSVLTGVLSGFVTPLIYIYVALSVADAVIGNETLQGMKKFVKWAATWTIKIILYVFTGYLGVVGVVSGSVDAAAIKAAKLAISGAVPVVGSILSDASETILVSAGVMKNAAGVYGLLAMIAICIGPFLRIGVQYLLLKITAAVCGVFGNKKTCGIIHDFSAAMGLVLAMTGTVCLLLLISIVCFIKGVA